MNLFNSFYKKLYEIKKQQYDELEYCYNDLFNIYIVELEKNFNYRRILLKKVGFDDGKK